MKCSRIGTTLKLLLLLGSSLVMGGCSSKLETGYQPRPLGASDAERRGYYSPKYTRAAAMAEQDRERDDQHTHRPDYRPGM